MRMSRANRVVIFQVDVSARAQKSVRENFAGGRHDRPQHGQTCVRRFHDLRTDGSILKKHFLHYLLLLKNVFLDLTFVANKSFLGIKMFKKGYLAKELFSC